MKILLYTVIFLITLSGQINYKREDKLLSDNVEKMKNIISYNQKAKYFIKKQIALSVNSIVELIAKNNSFKITNERLSYSSIGIIKEVEFNSINNQHAKLKVEIFVGTMGIKDTHELLLQHLTLTDMILEQAYKVVEDGPGDFCIANLRSSKKSAKNILAFSRYNYAFSIRSYDSEMNLIPIANEIDNYILNFEEDYNLLPQFSPNIQIVMKRLYLPTTLKVGQIVTRDLQMNNYLSRYHRFDIYHNKNFISTSINENKLIIKGMQRGEEEIGFIFYDIRTMRSINYKKNMAVK